MRIGVRAPASRTAVRTFRVADITGVEAQAVEAGLERGKRPAVVEVDVRDERQGRLLDDLRQRLGGGLVGDGDADDLAANFGQLVDLAQRRRDVRRVRCGHRLDDDGCVSANLHVADVDGLGLAPLGHRLQGSAGRRAVSVAMLDE
jgi:hypothetical protein